MSFDRVKRALKMERKVILLKAWVKRRASHEPNRMQMGKKPLFSLIKVRRFDPGLNKG